MAETAAAARAVATGSIHLAASSSDVVLAAQLEACVTAGDASATRWLLAEAQREQVETDPELLRALKQALDAA